MQKILKNIALFELTKRCTSEGMDVSSTYIYKVPRKWKYYLTKEGTHRALALAVFSATSAPVYIVYSDSNYNGK